MSLHLVSRPPILAALLILLVTMTTPVRGVVISLEDDTPNVRAPATNPFWLNVGRVSNGSAVYLGNRWVITANHVGEGDLRLSDGRVLAESIGSSKQLTNSGVAPFGSPDLRMFRLAEDPGLPELSLSTATPAVGTQVMMIGAGSDRARQATAWQTRSTNTGLAWTEVSLDSANVLGYSVLSSSTMRWGLNNVSSGATFSLTDPTRAFTTRWDYRVSPFEAQATTGDSGGGVFQHTTAGWELSGLMFANQPLVDQPGNTVVYGETTLIADLAAYGQQIMSLMTRAEPLWQNQANNYDVNGDAKVSTSDLLTLVNELLRDENHTRDLNGVHDSSAPWYDVNGDYKVSTSDLLGVSNKIIADRRAAAASPLSAVADTSIGTPHLIPEPATSALALAGALVIGIQVIRRQQRR